MAGLKRLDAEGRQRANELENWDSEQLAWYAAGLESVLKQACEDLNHLPTTQHELLSNIRDKMAKAISA